MCRLLFTMRLSGNNIYILLLHVCILLCIDFILSLYDVVSWKLIYGCERKYMIWYDMIHYMGVSGVSKCQLTPLELLYMSARNPLRMSFGYLVGVFRLKCIPWDSRVECRTDVLTPLLVLINPRPGGGLSHLRHSGGGGQNDPPPTLTRKLGKLEGQAIRRSTALSEPFEVISVIFSLRWILRSAEVIKGQIFEKWWFYQECRPLSRKL